MKNKTMNESIENKTPSWLYPDTQDDDFLSGKTPNNVEFSWEDEE